MTTKTREQVITSMCLTWRHDYGLVKQPPQHNESERIFDIAYLLQSGMYQHEREELWSRMAQIFDNDIAPYMNFKD